MKKKIWILMIVALMCIGGCSMMNKQETLTKERQDSIAKYVANNYENIRKIEFVEMSKNDKTGFSRVIAVINDSIWVSFQINNKTEEILLNHLASKNSGMFLQNKQNYIENASIENVVIEYLGESK